MMAKQDLKGIDGLDKDYQLDGFLTDIRSVGAVFLYEAKLQRGIDTISA